MRGFEVSPFKIDESFACRRAKKDVALELAFLVEASEQPPRKMFNCEDFEWSEGDAPGDRIIRQNVCPAVELVPLGEFT